MYHLQETLVPRVTFTVMTSVEFTSIYIGPGVCSRAIAFCTAIKDRKVRALLSLRELIALRKVDVRKYSPTDVQHEIASSTLTSAELCNFMRKETFEATPFWISNPKLDISCAGKNNHLHLAQR